MSPWWYIFAEQKNRVLYRKLLTMVATVIAIGLDVVLPQANTVTNISFYIYLSSKLFVDFDFN